jgi:hypothetical protein
VEPAEHELEGRYTFGHSRFDETRFPSGRLTLHIDHGQEYWSCGCRRTWRPWCARLPRNAPFAGGSH